MVFRSATSHTFRRRNRLCRLVFKPAVFTAAAVGGTSLGVALEAQQSGAAQPRIYARESEGVEVSAGAFAEVTASRNSGSTVVGPTTTVSQQISQSATPAAGFLTSVRQSFGPFLGYVANIGYTRYTDNYTNGISSNLSAFPYTSLSAGFSRGSIQTDEVELTGAYVVHAPHRGRYAPFAEMGGGFLTFIPTPSNQPVSYTYRLTGLVGMGVSYKLSPRLELRAEYRGLFFKSPDFRYGQGSQPPAPQIPVTSRYTLSQQPALSLSYRFGGLKRGLQ